MIFGPNPSIFIALREAKWVNCSCTCAGHIGLMQRNATSSSRWTSFWPHDGHFSGIGAGGVLAGRFLTRTRETSGIISPALCNMTVSPMRISLSRIMSALCNVARATVVPANWTGSITAVGVTTPVRPTVHTISWITVLASSGGNL